MSDFRDNTAPSRFADYREVKPEKKTLRDKLQSDIESFLAEGGEIEKIKKGRSGAQTKTHFVINYVKGEIKR